LQSCSGSSSASFSKDLKSGTNRLDRRLADGARATDAEGHEHRALIHIEERIWSGAQILRRGAPDAPRNQRGADRIREGTAQGMAHERQLPLR
jgi:hypothetical protein